VNCSWVSPWHGAFLRPSGWGDADSSARRLAISQCVKVDQKTSRRGFEIGNLRFEKETEDAAAFGRAGMMTATKTEQERGVPAAPRPGEPPHSILPGAEKCGFQLGCGGS